MSTSRRVAKNFLLLSLGEVVVRVLGTVLSIYVARSLGAQVFGQFAFATAFVAFFNVFADFGLTTVGIRNIARAREETNVLATNIEVLQVGISLLLVALLGVTVLFLPLDGRSKLIFFLFGLNMIPLALNLSFVFQAHEQMEWVALGKVVSQVAYLVAGFGVVYVLRDILWLPLVLALTSLVGVVVVYLGAVHTLQFRFTHLNWAQMWQLLRVSLPLVWASFAIQIYYNVDSVMLGFQKSQEVVGVYNSAYKIVLFVITLGGMLTGAIFPLLSSSYAQNRPLFERTLREWGRINAALALPVLVGGILLARPILTLIYHRPEYLGATLAFQILVCLPLIIFWSGVYGNALIAIDQQAVATRGVIIGAVVNLLVNFLLISRYSLNGAALATVLAEGAVLLYQWWQFRRLNVAPTASFPLFRPLMAAVGMGLVIWLTRDHVPVIGVIILAGLVYLSLLVIVKGVTMADVQLLRKSPSVEAS